MRTPARFSWVATAAAVATAMVIGATVFAGGHAPNGGPAPSRPPVGGPMARHPHVVAKYLGPTAPYAGPTPDIACDEGSRPEKVQGKAPKADYASGRAAMGYYCNARM